MVIKDAPADTILANKVIYKFFLSAETTSKTHDFIGTNGVITIGSDSVQPSLKYTSDEFIFIDTPNFEADTVFDGERAFFN